MKKNTPAAKKTSPKPLKRVKKTSVVLAEKKLQKKTPTKLDSILEPAPIAEPVYSSPISPITEKKGSSLIWIIATIVLAVAFIGLLAYEYSPDFKMSVNKILGMKGSESTTTDDSKLNAPKVIHEIPLTIVYDSKSPDQKQAVENYLKNLETNLENTKATVTWLDKDDAQAKDYLAKTERKFLPLFVTAEKIKEHPRYNDFAAAVKEKNGVLFLQSEGMEYLEVPPVGTAKYDGVEPAKAKVVIIEYASMTCHYCKEMEPVITEIRKAYPGVVSIVHKYFDRGGPDSVLAQGVECASDQGLLEPMMNLMYDRQDDLFKVLQTSQDQNKTSLDFMATAIKDASKGVKKFSINAFNQCLSSKKYEARIAADTAEGIEFGIAGTPSFFINKRFVGGAIPLESMKQIIDSELKK